MKMSKFGLAYFIDLRKLNDSIRKFQENKGNKITFIIFILQILQNFDLLNFIDRKKGFQTVWN